MGYNNSGNRSGEAIYCYACMSELKRKVKKCPHCNSPVPYVVTNPQLLAPGTLLNSRYKLGRPLGSGGFGATYLAIDLMSNDKDKNIRKCAIKEYFPSNLCVRSTSGPDVLPAYTEMDDYKKYLKSFLDESQRLRKLSGTPGIVNVTDAFQENGTAYYIMEYLSGDTLKTYMKSKPVGLPIREALDLIGKVLISLSAVHKHDMLHRDISAGNLIFRQDGTLTLIDFGSARETRSENKTVFVKGRYTAPEQKYGSRQGPYTDVYSVGVLLFYMLVGRLPAQNGEDIQYAKRDLPQSVCSLVDKATQQDPRSRYQTAEEMLADVNRCAAVLPKSPPQPEGKKPKSKKPPKNTAEIMKNKKRRRKLSGFKKFLLVLLLFLLFVLICFILLLVFS